MKYKNLPGFSLIEMALVLIVIGILAGAILKGQNIMEAAKVRAVLNDIERVRTAAVLYHDTFGQWPGNDSLASTRFGEGVQNGKGDGVLTAGESAQFWVHLAKAGHLSNSAAPSSKLGGNFTVETDPLSKKILLILSGPEKAGLLTPQQASMLKTKAGESSPLTGQIQVTEGKNSSPHSCVKEGVFHLVTNAPTCILRVELH
ncbi:MAG: prepilin-type N-terminal cleavage/methylation domain-containing protein [Alphaproteobacteria bacterium]|nr:prepilin-type N-terminal cleavage/methylation domain-containing protein [Alphaproteobacteria bacterium]